MRRPALPPALRAFAERGALDQARYIVQVFPDILRQLNADAGITRAATAVRDGSVRLPKPRQKPKRTMSAAGRAAISAARKRYWESLTPAQRTRVVLRAVKGRRRAQAAKRNGGGR